MNMFLSLGAHGQHGAFKSKIKSIVAMTGVLAMATWALFESSSSIDDIYSPDAPHYDIRRTLSEQAVGNVTLASDKPSILEKFIIISSQRSGTRFIASLIDKHSDIRCGHEDLFLRLGQHPLDHLVDMGSLEKYMEQVHLSFELLPRLQGNNIDDNLTHVGFEIMYNQGIITFHSDLLREFHKENVKIIHLIRKNKLLQYISDASNNEDRKNPVESKHNAHPTSDAEVKDLQTITVDGRDIKKIMTYIDDKVGEDQYITELLLAEFGEDGYHTVYYENLNNDNQGEMNRIFDHLGVEHEEVESEFAKIHEGYRAREYFGEDDIEEVEKAIKESKYAFMLEPDLPGYLGW